MKKILYLLGLVLLISGITTSCKKDTFEALREAEIKALDEYVKDHDLAEYKDPSGIYFKLLHRSDDTTRIFPGFKVMLNYNITTLADTAKDVLSTEDENGYSFEEDAFYVDVNDANTAGDLLQQIAGMHIGLKMMHIGDKALFVIPSQLAYKAVTTATPLGAVPRFSTLLVTVYAKKGYAPTTEEEEEQ